MYSNFEEIQKEYPIGKPLKWTEEYTTQVYYYTEKDLDAYRKMYKKVIMTEENTCLVTVPERVITSVEGYLFDGEKFYPAYQTWDGWQIWEENE